MVLEEVDQKPNGVILGALTHGRYDNIPGRSKRGEKTKDLNITDEEYVTEMTGFAYFPATKTLVYQNNIHGISLSRFERYLMGICHTAGPVSFRPKISSDAWLRLKKMERVSSFTVEAALPPNPSARGAFANDSLASMFRTTDKYNGLQIKVEISVGRQQTKSLDRKQVVADAEEIMRQADLDEAIVNKLIARGSVKGEKTKSINLIEDIIYHKCKVKSPGRRIEFDTISRAILDSYAEKRKLLP